jgi:hypothetical protein
MPPPRVGFDADTVVAGFVAETAVGVVAPETLLELVSALSLANMPPLLLPGFFGLMLAGVGACAGKGGRGERFGISTPTHWRWQMCKNAVSLNI